MPSNSRQSIDFSAKSAKLRKRGAFLLRCVAHGFSRWRASFYCLRRVASLFLSPAIFHEDGAVRSNGRPGH
ncbi:hypothetical protein CW354_19995 [Marinicaulis flavus]|uniref:Uncharacterized protein n=1 Tax=Hyphococcus luteus TaxID=2058213 RepID=A0A2S7JZZ8_9PROT|nr:hypothetical protein CW354_19995 [Marinicaulis flavus]